MDDLDRRIVAALQANGRKSNAELARELGVAASTMLERLRRLEERHIIDGYRATVDPVALGLTVQGFICVTLDRHDVGYIQQFEQEIVGIPAVRACYHTTGRFDYMLHVAARDLTHLGELVKEQIAGITGIGKAETFLVLSEVKPDSGWPVELSQKVQIAANNERGHTS
jgi:Lrp/AsnC family leucine-responsive transcriptional regulator